MSGSPLIPTTRSPGSIPSSMANEAGATASTRPGNDGAKSTRRWESGLTATGLMVRWFPEDHFAGRNAERRRHISCRRHLQRSIVTDEQDDMGRAHGRGTRSLEWGVYCRYQP